MLIHIIWGIAGLVIGYFVGYKSSPSVILDDTCVDCPLTPTQMQNVETVSEPVVKAKKARKKAK